MNHSDHIELLKPGIDKQGGRWADLGAGSGAFTLALAEIIGLDGKIIAIDKDKRALESQALSFKQRLPDHQVEQKRGDFSKPLDLHGLDGIVIANALHFIRRRRQVDLLTKIGSYLAPAGRLIIVEYGTDNGNMWVPHPFSYPTFATMAQAAGYKNISKLSSRPSRFLGEIYSAIAYK